MASRVDLIYKLENVDAEDGIDVFEIAPILMQFGELVRNANNVLGFEQKIDIKVKYSSKHSYAKLNKLSSKQTRARINFDTFPIRFKYKRWYKRSSGNNKVYEGTSFQF